MDRLGLAATVGEVGGGGQFEIKISRGGLGRGNRCGSRRGSWVQPSQPHPLRPRCPGSQSHRCQLQRLRLWRRGVGGAGKVGGQVRMLQRALRARPPHQRADKLAQSSHRARSAVRARQNMWARPPSCMASHRCHTPPAAAPRGTGSPSWWPGCRVVQMWASGGELTGAKPSCMYVLFKLSAPAAVVHVACMAPPDACRPMFTWVHFGSHTTCPLRCLEETGPQPTGARSRLANARGGGRRCPRLPPACPSCHPPPRPACSLALQEGCLTRRCGGGQAAENWRSLGVHEKWGAGRRPGSPASGRPGT